MISSTCMSTHHELEDQAELLVRRLERLSVDSVWAHRASGLRGSLLHTLDRVEETQGMVGTELRQQLAELVSQGFKILTAAAREIRTPDEPGSRRP